MYNKKIWNSNGIYRLLMGKLLTAAAVISWSEPQVGENCKQNLVISGQLGLI